MKKNHITFIIYSKNYFIFVMNTFLTTKQINNENYYLSSQSFFHQFDLCSK